MNRLRKQLWMVCAALLAASIGPLGSSCTGSADSPAELDPVEEPEITISGSGTLVPLFHRLIAAYQEVRPAARLVLLPGTSTGGGVEGVRRGVLDVGLCSRRLTPAEEGPEIAYHPLGSDLIVFAAHPSSKVPGLSPEELRRIYRGEIRNWSEVGGVDRPILVLERDEGESIKITLRRYFFSPAFQTLGSATVFLHAGDMAEALRTTPHSVGYAGRGELRSRSLELLIVPPLGRWPRPEEVHSGRYPLVVHLGVVSSRSPPPEVLRFVSFLLGAKGRAVLDALGCFPALPVSE